MPAASRHLQTDHLPSGTHLNFKDKRKLFIMLAALRHLQLIDLPFGCQLATLTLTETLQNACGRKTFTTGHLPFGGHFVYLYIWSVT